MKQRLTSTQIPRGFSFASAACGLKKSGLDLGLLVSEVQSAAAAVFTTNEVKAAPVLVSRAHLKVSRRRVRGVIVNSGNANCCTGPEGYVAAAAMALQTARELGHLHPSQILVCSTGVIGVPLPVERILAVVSRLVRGRAATPAAFAEFTRAIMTTDTRPKWAAAKCRIGGKEVRLLGCTKGAGMVHPNMATMLAFIATDAAISSGTLQRALRHAVAGTFNAITVDGDTSTNDTVMVLANGESAAKQIAEGGIRFRRFCEALEEVCRSLALAIVADGEGAQRVIEIEVRGAPSARAADRVARTIANSPLVKTALAGADPNWGRILAAAGRSGVAFDPDRVEIHLAGLTVFRRGRACPFSERAAHRKLLAKYIPIVVNLGWGAGNRKNAHARIWTCDFTGDYVRINASYRS
jgi:glutamate N-acetyltransferase / amino-acid N-acetyltransferase